ncbi:T9SS type A sorting domain-containing protein [Candidatus Marinimicrobia bacterium MT.SAG.3]|nr:T9SS type A sorting domain-containing protein [Candidatus Marinimicrobia bacterium MT.SAG.3]
MNLQKNTLLLILCCCISIESYGQVKPNFKLPKLTSTLKSVSFRSSVPDSFKILAIRVEFKKDVDEGSTGNGLFDLTLPALGSDFQFDPPPHNSIYFLAHIKALSNYYKKVSNGKVIIDLKGSVLTPSSRNGAYSLSDSMRFYSPNLDDETNDQRLAQLFYQSIKAASIDIADFNAFDLVTIFHAGVGKDFVFQLDLSPFDVPSAYLDSDFLSKYLTVAEFSELQAFGVEKGIILPETQSQEGFDIALNGTFALLFGSFLGLPSLWDTDTGNPGIGKWGLMDQGSNNMSGSMPAYPSAFTRIIMGWDRAEIISSGTAVPVAMAGSDSGTHIYRIPINSKEYFLVENRSNRSVKKAGFDSLKVGRDTTFVKFDSEKSGVIVNVVNYDAGLPGSGLLIWHIDNEVIAANRASNSINNDIDNRGVALEEGDGSEDIGHEFGFLQPGGGSEVGSPWDPFYAKNPAWYFQNPNFVPENLDSAVAFTSKTNPDNKSNSGAFTGLNFTNISKAGDLMTFDLSSDLLANGFPVFFTDLEMPGSNSPAVADFNNDGNKELFIALPNGRIQIWTMNGDMVQEYSPYRNLFTDIGDTVDGSIVVTDLGGNDSLELIVAGINGIVQMFEVNILGFPLPPNLATPVWTVDIESKIIATPLVAEGAIYVGGVDGSITKIDYGGNILSTSSGTSTIRSMAYSNTSGLIHSGEHVVRGIINQNQAFYISVNFDGIVKIDEVDPLLLEVSSSGYEPLQFRYDTGDSILSSPALADIDADGELELIITGNNKLWAFNGNLSLVANFPVTINGQNPVGQIQSSPVIGDVDGDGLPDIVFGAPNGLVYGYHGDGSLVDGFPLSTGGSIHSTLVIDDVIPGGPIEIVAASNDGYLYMWSMLEDAEADPLLPWPTFAGNNERMNYAPPSTFDSPAANEKLLEPGKVFAYPNPAKGNETRIRYFVSEVSSVDIMIFDMAGEYVDALQDEHIIQNEYNETVWNVSRVSSGVYLARVTATGVDGSSSSTIIKIAVVK